MNREITYAVRAITDNPEPDFSLLDKLLDEGLDINTFTPDICGEKIDDETILSECLNYYGDKFWEKLSTSGIMHNEQGDNHYRRELPQIVEIVKYFLERGYDVHANEEYHGMSPLEMLAFSGFFDQYSVEAVKLLLDAGSDTDKQRYDDEEYTSIHWLMRNHDGDYRGICETEYYAANYFYTIDLMMNYRDEGKDYSQVFHPDRVIGKKIRGVYVLERFCDDYTVDGERTEFAFEKIYLDCEGFYLIISDEFEIAVDPYLNGIDPDRFQDCSGSFDHLVNVAIENIYYLYQPLGSCIIALENGEQIIFEKYLRNENRVCYIR